MDYESRKRLDELLGRKRRASIDYGPDWAPDWASRSRYRWLENATRGAGLRLVATHDDLPGHDRGRAWYVDSGQDETTAAAVLQLPARGGRPQYVPTCTDPWNADCFLVDFHAVTDDLRDALRWADSMAERYAEDAREGDAKYQAEMQIADARDAIKAAREAASCLAREIRSARVASAAGGRLREFPAICHALRVQVARYRAEVSEHVQRIHELTDNPWAAVK